MIVTYNKEQVGDVLMLTLKNSGEAKLAVERKGKVARVYREDNQETVAWNIFDASSFFAIEGKGQVFLTDEQVDRLNQELEREGFSERLVNDQEQKFVVGEILEMLEQIRRFRSSQELQMRVSVSRPLSLFQVP